MQVQNRVHSLIDEIILCIKFFISKRYNDDIKENSTLCWMEEESCVQRVHQGDGGESLS